ncbi:MAG: molybdopterin-dependent oxidoreductase [Ilumatobacteraceae bacterium]|nr:molybdopterin-dependent oxidoreductase [Ilumatobacteraceae bacterium]
MADTVTDSRLVHGVCHHDCPDSCGWSVTVESNDSSDPVAVALRGNREHPYSQGELCPKVNRMLDRVYSPDRLLTPLRRTGPKGAGTFEPISWDDALATIAQRTHQVIDEHGPEAVLPFSDAGNQGVLAMMGLSSRFFGHMGATRLIRAICGPTVGAGMSMTNGTGRAMDPAELEHSRLIILWGTNTRLTNRHLWPTIERARAAGAQLVVIDPLRTMTAEAVDEARGDRFVQPRPGTDVALMLAMMRVIIHEGLTNTEWVDAHTVAFDELVAAVEEWSPARAAEVTGVDADTIVELARDYATTTPAAIRTLVGAEHHENGAMFFRTMACLPALTGAWAERGGGIAKSVGSYSDALLDVQAFHRPDLDVRIDGELPRVVNMSRLGEVLTSAHAAFDDGPGIHALFVWNCNPLVIVPNAEAIRRGLERDDLFTVVHEQFLTDSARYADIVLPATTQIEADDVMLPWGHLWATWNGAAIPPVGESCSNTELFRRLAGAMGYTEPTLFDDDETLLRNGFPTIDLDELRTTGWLRVPYPDDGRPFGDGDFETASRRVEFASDLLEQIGQPRVPTYVPPRESPGGDPDLATLFPFQLLTPKHHVRFLNSSYPQLPKHGPPEGGPFVEVHADDAQELGVSEGSEVRVWNQRGSLQLPVRISTRVRPGLVAVPFGWWRDHHDHHGTANSLTNDTLTEWGGGVAYSDTLVDVAPV